MKPRCKTPTLKQIIPRLENSAAWKKHSDEVRENEWALYKKMLALLHQALDQRAARYFDKMTVDEIAVLVEAALKLGSHALGIPYPATNAALKKPAGDLDSARRDMETDLRRAYGDQPEPPPSVSSPDTTFGTSRTASRSRSAVEPCHVQLPSIQPSPPGQPPGVGSESHAP